MRTIRVFIERGRDGSYGAYMPDDDNLSYCINGEGTSVSEAIDDFKAVYQEMKQAAQNDGFPFEEVEFAFSYDLPSFLVYYADILSYKGLSKLTGISPAQLSQYISGYRTPSLKTTQKIQNAIHIFGNELSQLQLV